jgi:N-acetylmuramoyl-L-alanine amidase
MKKLMVSIVLLMTTLATAEALPKLPTYAVYTEEDITWLTKNIYFEAANQETAGRIAVLMVTLNRVAHDRFPDNIKSVVTQGGTKLHRCQFSWYCDGKPDTVRDWEAFNEIKQLVLAYMHIVSKSTDITSGAIYYHATYVKPKWASQKKKIIRIGDHIFYK